MLNVLAISHNISLILNLQCGFVVAFSILKVSSKKKLTIVLFAMNFHDFHGKLILVKGANQLISHKNS
jgi:hypothetical protein